MGSETITLARVMLVPGSVNVMEYWKDLGKRIWNTLEHEGNGSESFRPAWGYGSVKYITKQIDSKYSQNSGNKYAKEWTMNLPIVHINIKCKYISYLSNKTHLFSFPVPVMEPPDKRYFREYVFVLAHSFRVPSVLIGKSVFEAAAHIASPIEKR